MRITLLLLMLALALVPLYAQSGQRFEDEFNGAQLDAAKWEVFKGTPTVSNGWLTLMGSSGERTEIQSKRQFLYGTLTVVVESRHWQAQTDSADADASFGLEIFASAAGTCHYGALLKADGHLGLLRPQPDGTGRCVGNPANQEHPPLPNWETLRTNGRIVLMLIWMPDKVTLRVSDGNATNSVIMSMPNSPANPNVPLRIRLNADINETYRVDYVRWAEAPLPIRPNEFVTRAGHKLMLGQREFRFGGTNTYDLQPQIAYDKPENVSEVLDKMLALNMNVARTIGFNDHVYKNSDARCGDKKSEVNGDDPAAIQLQPGVFCEPNLIALDQAIAAAKARNLRLILYLTNNFDAYGGKRRYVQWRLKRAPEPEELGVFYTDAQIKQWFKDYVTMLLTRRNKVTGILYKDEPTVLAWELGNELRNPTANASERPRRADELLAWQREMAAHIKNLDANHLVADGGEGFDDAPMNYPGLSNLYPVRGDESCSFSRLVREPNIDLLSYHFYPAKWRLNDDRDAEIWIRVHEQLARAAGKPAYLGEFGARPSGPAEPTDCKLEAGRAFDTQRAQTYARWLRWAVEEHCTAGQLHWQMAYDTRTDCDGFAVYCPRDGQSCAVLQRYAGYATAPPLVAGNAASYDRTMLTADSIAVLFGVGLATSTQVASSLPLPTSLAGGRVLVRDALGVERPTPLFFVAPNQTNFLLPPDTALGLATVRAVLNDEFVSCSSFLVTKVAPGLFAANANGQGPAAALALRIKPDGVSTYEVLARFDGARNQFVPAPLDLGTVNEQIFLVLFGTGIRRNDGLTMVSCNAGGVNLPVLYAGPVNDAVGLDQINAGPLPRSLAGRGELDVVCTVEGKTTNTVRIAIR